MPQSVTEALAALRNLATPDEARQLAAKGYAPATRPKSNAHIHLPPNFSAFESVEQAVGLAAKEGMGVVSVGNYYDYAVYAEFVERARQAGIFPMFGTEIICLVDDLVKGGVKINDPGNPGKFYFCGKAITRFDETTPRATELLAKIRGNDTVRMAEMTALVGKVFTERGLPISLTADDVIDMIVRRHGSAREMVTIQERHICQAYQEALFAAVAKDERLPALEKVFGTASKAASDEAVKIQNEIRSHVMKAGKPAFVDETFVTFPEAHELVLELGGIPAYPTLADGTDPICGFEDPVEELIEEIKGRKIFAAEYIPLRNTPEVLSKYVKAMRAEGLAVTAGTEHNTLDLIPIEPKCLQGVEVPEEIKDIFWEGTCVTAAHQFLTLHGECGFVDDRGDLNSDYSDNEARIKAFAAIGAAVIQRYYETVK